MVKTFLPCILFSLFAANVSASPNLVFILTDNQSADLLPAYGNRDLQTPGIDRIANNGVLFSNAYAVNGMCSPTRATLMTGLIPSQHGVHNWLDDEQMDEWPSDWIAIEGYRTLPAVLKEAGYKTAMIGKWHLGQPWKASIGYEHWVTFTDGHTVDFWNNQVIDNDRRYEVSGRHIVDFFAQKAVEYIEEQSPDEPFYLQLNFDGPYVNPPTNVGAARNRHYEKYVGLKFLDFPVHAIHPNLTQQLLALNRDGRETSFLARVLEATLLMNGDQSTRANIASQSHIVDDGVTAVLDALEERGLLEDTLVVFSSDQGNFFGQHGLWTHTIITEPSNLYDTAMHIPLLFMQPGTIPAGERYDGLIAQYDIPATIIGFLGLNEQSLEKGPGQSHHTVLASEFSSDKPLRDVVFFEQEETRGLRTHHMTYWERLAGLGPSELYDLRSDPDQLVNLADDPRYLKMAQDLSQELSQFFEQWAAPEYDLWRGGSAKGSVQRPEMFRRIYGSDWRTTLGTNRPPR